METPTGAPARPPLDVLRTGVTGYRACWTLQKELHADRLAGRRPDTLVLTSHPHVYTIGKSGSDDHLLAGEGELAHAGVEMVRTDRGGDITYHGPGQLVGYPILHLERHGRDLHRYLRDLEQALILTLGAFGLKGEREPGYTGVWVAGEKIAAIGVRVAGWVTMHGFALNVSTDLSYFHRIIPCGITHLGVTSMERSLGAPVDPDAVAGEAIRRFAEVFGLSPRAAEAESSAAAAARTVAEAAAGLRAGLGVGGVEAFPRNSESLTLHE